MDLPVNKFKKAIAKGETQYGLWAGIPDTTSAEICAGTGFDWLLLDGEHAPFDMRAIYTYLQAIAPYDIHPIVRAVKGDKNLIKQLLDFGAQTLLIPMVDTAEQAEELVQAMRYPPEGIRGMGSSIARAARWNAIPDYLQHANDEICLLIQAESTTALENLPEILKVEGVDGVFIGPSDLSASMGHVGNAGHAEVVSTIEQSIESIVKAGKAAGILAIDPTQARHYISKGASFVGVGVDTLLLRNSAVQLAASFKSDTETVTTKPKSGY
ncbi:MAG: 4-hydroxy-2-oxoheptanedioate aldolase [Planctomycetota bacterium]|jgi:4-hydroxy-2-oxoheptanedioate aldolase